MNTTATPISTADHEALARESWVDAATVEAWGLYRVSTAEGARLVGRTTMPELCSRCMGRGKSARRKTICGGIIRHWNNTTGHSSQRGNISPRRAVGIASCSDLANRRTH
jgi:hypothetical protein